TPSGLGFAPSSSSSSNLYVEAAGFCSGFGSSSFLAFTDPPPGFDGPPGLVGPLDFGAFGSFATNAWPQCLHLIFLPKMDSGTLRAFSQSGLGQEISTTLDMDSPQFPVLYSGRSGGADGEIPAGRA